jgi:thioesterase domain-containing protein
MNRGEAVTMADSRAQQLENHLRSNIPIAQHMGLSVASLDHRGVMITAPLQPNINDKGTAFGGSLLSLALLAGWGLLEMEAAASGMDCDIVIHHGEVAFKRPVSGLIRVQCSLPERHEWDRFQQSFQRNGRARIALDPQVLDEQGGVAVRFPCKYVAIGRESI